MKQEDARGAHTGSCEFGDGGARHYGICGHCGPQSKCIVLTTLVNDRKICILELNFFLFKGKSGLCIIRKDKLDTYCTR